ncbi:MAG: hypothetical protein HC779_02180, partial [Phyllobacteriaceae bacterium]|nr:hypothetical protein [Phyllobacteriaceae bacterium]
MARGGIRWSDRAQDFRAEVLGLVRAQRGCLLAAALLFWRHWSVRSSRCSSRRNWCTRCTTRPSSPSTRACTTRPPRERKLGRDSGSDVMMFGYYVMNNVSIAFRTLPPGSSPVVGTLFVLLQNGLLLGV